MKKFLIILLFLIFYTGIPAFSIEIESTKAIKTFYYVLPDEEETINTKPDRNENWLPSEVELKGSVIYDEGASYGEIKLDENIEKPKIRLKTASMVIPVDKKQVYTTDVNIPAKSALSTASRLTGEEYIIAPVRNYVQESVGNFSYGTIYSSVIDTAQLQSTINLYTRYDSKYFAITGAVASTEKNNNYANYDKNIQIAPEIKLSKSFVIRDTVQAYVNTDCKKNKISIIYTPQWQKRPDTVKIELGITQSYYSGGRVNSAIEFSTKIKL